MQTIRVLIADDIAETRANVRRLLEIMGGFEVVGEAADGESAVKKALQLQPDCVLLDVNMPLMDGITAAEQLFLCNQDIAIVMMSVSGEQEYLRRAMGAGARDYLLKPFGAEEAARAVRRAVAALQRGGREAVPIPTRLLLVAGPKGGVGRTTVAVNLAVGLAMAGERTCLMDLNVQFGDAAMALDVVPSQTLIHLADVDEDSEEGLQTILQRHTSGLHLLAAPIRPEEAELVRPELVRKALTDLQGVYEWVMIDGPAGVNEAVLMVLDQQPECLLVVTPEMAAVRNASQLVQLWRALDYDVSKARVILNRVTGKPVIPCDMIEQHLGLPISFQIPEDATAMNAAGVSGRPVLMDSGHTRSGEALQRLVDDLRQVKAVPTKRRLFELAKQKMRWVVHTCRSLADYQWYAIRKTMILRSASSRAIADLL